MGWRILHLSQPARLKLQHHALLIERKEEEDVEIPCEDIASIILDTQEVSITGAVLSKCCELGIAIIVPDQKHHPAGMVLSFHQHYAQAEITHLQISMSEPFKKRIWQKIIQIKIMNQAQSLAAYGTEEGRERAKFVNGMALLVKSGDPKNVEAQAARLYWQNLLSDFKRADSEDYRNSLLNYGYAIARAALARSLVAAGLLPSIGVHHDSKLNAFNLVDDMSEPFRPFVDAHMMKYLKEREETPKKGLTLEDRRYMTRILDISVMMPDLGEQTFLAATERTAYSLAKVIKTGKIDELMLPAFIREKM